MKRKFSSPSALSSKKNVLKKLRQKTNVNKDDLTLESEFSATNERIHEPIEFKAMRKSHRNKLWDNLPWKSMSMQDMYIENDDNAVFLGLEEVDGQQLSKLLPTKITTTLNTQSQNVSIQEKELKKEAKKTIYVPEIIVQEEIPTNIDLTNEAWNNSNVSLCKTLVNSLNRLGFTSPTPIQETSICKTLSGTIDLLGIAETGSGKTLAFVLPILTELIGNWTVWSRCKFPIAMIIAPTRELVKQIVSVCDSISKVLSFEAHIQISIVSIIGGLSEHKQIRQLQEVDKKPVHILVATPGRLHELIQKKELIFFQDMSRLRFLVIDEVDRMMEDGHFPELFTIFQQIVDHERLVREGKSPIEVAYEKEFGKAFDDRMGLDNDTFTFKEDRLDDLSCGECPFIEYLPPDIDEQLEEAKSHDPVVLEPESIKPVVHNSTTRQTLLFSATANFQAKVEVSRKKIKGLGSKNPLIRQLPHYIQELIALVCVQPSFQIIDVTRQASEANSISLPQTLEQLEMKVTLEEKDAFLYQYVLHHPGKVLVFANSIEVAKRIDGLLRSLRISSCAIHGKLQQKQRLKAIEAFQQSTNIVLVATDVAARGLDINNVQHVVHYDIARSPQLYVHRSGRTARNKKSGVSLSLISPEDAFAHQQICLALQMKSLSPWKADLVVHELLKERVRVAKKVSCRCRVF